MSNPGALSVDQLERQQRSSVSPVSEIEGKSAPKKVSDLESDLKAKLHIGLSKPPGVGNSSGMPDSSKAQVSVRTVDQVNSMVPPYSVPTYAPVPISAPTYAPGPLVPAYAPGPSHTLLSPQVFSTRSTQSPSPSRLTNGSSHKVTPLTRGQMLEAVQYLLDNDEEFVTKLHEAYVRSLNSKIENF
jgi:mRNA-decapping enzyme 1B